jgi:5-methylcytosine-specific restriction endonuclease McrA
MATSPQRRHIERPSPLVEKPPERRQTSAERGYGTAWTKYAANLRLERVFCELCESAFGIETPCAGQTTTESGRKRSQGVVDHVIPVANSADPLFWDTEAHWILCRECDSFKSTHFDGTYGKSKIVARSRDLDGVRLRKAEIIAAMRKASGCVASLATE